MPNQRKRHISQYGNSNRTICGRAMAETDTPFVDTVSSVDDLRAQIISANMGKEVSLAIVGSVESDNLCSNCATRFEDEVQLYQGYLERNELLKTSLTIEPNGQVGFKMWGEVVATADEPIELMDAVDNALATGEISEGAHKTHIQSILDEQDRRQRRQDEKAEAAQQKKRRDTPVRMRVADRHCDTHPAHRHILGVHSLCNRRHHRLGGTLGIRLSPRQVLTAAALVLVLAAGFIQISPPLTPQMLQNPVARTSAYIGAMRMLQCAYH